MQVQQQMKKWSLEINGVIRAKDVIMSPEVDEYDVLEHILYHHKNSHKWPEEPRSLNLRYKMVDVKLNRNSITKSGSVQTFTKPLYTYQIFKYYE